MFMISRDVSESREGAFIDDPKMNLGDEIFMQ